MSAGIKDIKLSVAISTWKPEGIIRVAGMHLPVMKGVEYVVSWQETGENPVIPHELAVREDVLVHIFDRKGVSANRNNAMRYVSGEYVLMGDDDLRYTEDDLRAVIDTLDANPDVDVAMFKYRGSLKQYPSEPVVLGGKYPKNYSVTLFETAVRRSRIGDLRFDELYGPGAPVWHAAEDEKYLYDARKMGLKCKFFPIDITSHPHLTTGDRLMSTKGICAASGKYIRLENPVTWLLRVPLKAWREHKRGGRMFFSLYHMFRGALSNGRK